MTIKTIILAIADRLIKRRSSAVEVAQRHETWQTYKIGDIVRIKDGKYEDEIGEIIRPALFRVKKIKVALMVDWGYRNVWFDPSQLEILPLDKEI